MRHGHHRVAGEIGAERAAIAVTVVGRDEMKSHKCEEINGERQMAMQDQMDSAA